MSTNSSETKKPSLTPAPKKKRFKADGPATEYWYKTTVHYCPCCGNEKRYRERVYEKPINPYEFHDYYDYCLGV